MSTINSDIFYGLNENGVRKFPTISLDDLNEMKEKIMTKLLTGKQRRSFKNHQKQKNTKEFFGKATFSSIPSLQNSDSRTHAFNILSDKEKNSKRLEKTKMCRNILQKGVCNREVCTFAHTLEELKDPECAFGDTCRRKDTCKFKHPCESITAYHTRCNIVLPTIPPAPVESISSEIYEDCQRSVNEQSIKTVIRVPHELAEQEMLKAIESGIKNISIEII